MTTTESGDKAAKNKKKRDKAKAKKAAAAAAGDAEWNQLICLSIQQLFSLKTYLRPNCAEKYPHLVFYVIFT